MQGKITNMHNKDDRNKAINIHIHTYVHTHNTYNITMVTPIYDFILIKASRNKSKNKSSIKYDKQ